MPRLNWGAAGARFFEVGVDRGVLFVPGQDGVAWSGLISVAEKSSGGDPDAYYVDGVKFQNIPAPEEFEATINAFTYPDLFAVCDGTTRVRPGLFINQQPRQSFSLSYRTRIGNDLDGVDHAYKIHIVYNALAAPSDRDNKSLGDSSDPSDFTWDITTLPPAVSGYRRSGHIVVDSRYAGPNVMSALEDVIYGTDTNPAALPTLADLVTIFDTNATLTITDNGDGTFTAEGPNDVVVMLDSTHYSITADSVIDNGDDTFTLSSE